jgi:hypothetical protein
MAHHTTASRLLTAVSLAAIGSLTVAPLASAAGDVWTFTKTENGSNVEFQDGTSHTTPIIITNDAGRERYPLLHPAKGPDPPR